MRKAFFAVALLLLTASPARADWLQDTLAFQVRLGDPLPLVNAPWIGTHNSYNARGEPGTLSEQDPNQSLTITQQLDLGVRSLELDIHNIAGTPIVCHGRGAKEGHAGCTLERPFSERLTEVRAWLDAHPDAILLLYLEDHLEGAYDAGAAVLQEQLGPKLYLPPPGTCTGMPLEVSRRDIARAGKQVLAISSCGEGTAWRGLVFDDAHRAEHEGGVRDFKPDEACGYLGHFQRFYEDATRLSEAVNGARFPLTPELTRAMTACGVDLLGFDFLTADDGRLEATVWSWAKGQPSGPGCVVMRARFRVASCTAKRRHACRAADGSFTVTKKRAPWARRPRGCRRAVPRTGYEAARLRDAAGAKAVWLRLRRR